MVFHKEPRGNPGGVRDLLGDRPEEMIEIPTTMLDPGSQPAYGFATCETMMDKIRPVEDFLRNPNLRILKLYNTYFSRSWLNMSLESFLDSGTLASRVFLSIDPDREYWLRTARAIIARADVTGDVR
jgi:hypothetical protein